MRNLRKDRNIYIIILMALLLYIPLILFRDFTPTNELKYINIVDNMLKTNDWILLKFNGELYTDKPPLYFWIVGLLRMISGRYSLFLTAFLVCVIPAAITGIDMYHFLSENGLQKKNSMLSVLVLYTFVYFVGSAVIIRMDILMTMFITKALIWFYKVTEKDNKQYYMPYLYIGLGFLVKGLAAVFIPLGVIITYLLVTKQKNKLEKLRFLRGIIIILCFALLWIIPLILKLGFDNTIKELFLKQTVNRVVDAAKHKRSFYYYFINFLPNLMPWSLFFFASLGLFFFKIRKKDRFHIYVLCWFLIPFLIFSLVSGKLNIYMIPVYIPIAVITGEFITGEEYRKIVKILGILTSFIFLLFIIAAFIGKEVLDSLDTSFFYWILVYGIFSLSTFFLGIYFAFKEKMDKFIYNIWRYFV